MKFNIFRLILMSAISFLVPGNSMANKSKQFKVDDILLVREETVKLVVQIGSYNLENSQRYIDSLSDDQVKELFKVLSEKNIQIQGSITLIGN